MKWYILTDQGWIIDDEVLTPNTRNIKKNTPYTPVPATDELLQEIRKELPMVIERRGYLFIASL
jgi:hypothetical protein